MSSLLITLKFEESFSFCVPLNIEFIYIYFTRHNNYDPKNDYKGKLHLFLIVFFEESVIFLKFV